MVGKDIRRSCNPTAQSRVSYEVSWVAQCFIQLSEHFHGLKMQTHLGMCIQRWFWTFVVFIFMVRLLVLEVSEFTFSFLFNISLFERWEDEIYGRYHLEFRFGKISFPFSKGRY